MDQVDVELVVQREGLSVLLDVLRVDLLLLSVVVGFLGGGGGGPLVGSHHFH